MASTYDPSDLATNSKDAVRLIIGDTNMSAAMLQDEEITYVLTLRPSVYGAASQCASAIAAKFSRLADTAVDSVRISHSQKAKAYEALSAKLEALATTSAGAAYVGGISISDMQSNEQNSDRVPPIFHIGMDDDPPNGGADSLLNGGIVGP